MRMRRLAKLKTACVRSAAVETIVIGERLSHRAHGIRGTATTAVEIDVTMVIETERMDMVVDTEVGVQDTIEDRHRRGTEVGEGVDRADMCDGSSASFRPVKEVQQVRKNHAD
jgi:hypothetical protein